MTAQGVFRNVWVLALGIAILTLAVFEILLRLPVVQSLLPAPDYGTNNPELSIKIAQLDALVSQSGSIDCLFMGSSVMDNDADSGAFIQAYQAAGNPSINCYNFGLAGMPPTSAPTLARFLLARYHPRTLIYSLSAYELSDTFINEQQAVYEKAWVNYIGGDFSSEGWLYNTSFVARNLSTVKFFSDYQARTSYQDYEQTLTPHGRRARSNVFNYQPPAEVRSSNFVINQSGLEGFKQFLNLKNSENVQIIVVEEPLQPDTLAHDFLTGGVAAYHDQFQVPIGAVCNAQQVLCLDGLQANQLLPKTGWSDWNHLNSAGAKVFSTWLGNQIGQAVVQSQIQPLGH